MVALAARRRAPAAALVVRRRASVGALAAAARAARRWAGSGAASTSWTIRRYCYCAQCRTTLTSRPPTRFRRSGPCPARRPAATASRWSRPPTRAACTSGRRRGEPLLCCGCPSFGLPYSQYGSQRVRAMGALGQLVAWMLRQATNGTCECSRSVFYAAECQCNFAALGDHAGRTLD